MSETQEYIGKFHNRDLPRDAIHIAVVQVVAGEALKVGQRIGLYEDKRYVGKSNPYIGIVDPFLTDGPETGQKFYMFLYPNTAMGLTHQYKHPVLDADDPLIKAYNTIMDWITSNLYPDETERKQFYKLMIEQFAKGEAFDFDGRWRNEDDSESEDAEDPRLKPIYDALEIITGHKATKEQREKYYSCCI